MKKLTFLAVVVIGSLLNTVTAKAQSMQSDYCNAFANDAASGAGWTDNGWGYKFAELDERAGTLFFSKGLKAINFGFAIPSAATITGVEVVWQKGADIDDGIKDKAVRLWYAGPLGDNKKKSGFWPTSLASFTYGSASSLWGTTITPSMVNSSNFGAIMKCENMDINEGNTAIVNTCLIRVYYTMGSARLSVEASGQMVPEITVYPNPASEQLNIAVPAQFENGSIRVIDMTGNVVLEMQHLSMDTGQALVLDIAFLPAGYYILVTHDGRNTSARRFVKNK